MNEIGDGHDVQEIRITAEDLVGKTIREVNEEIPPGCIVAVIGREEQSHVPEADEKLQYGDHITFIGDADAVRQAMKRFHPHD
jgi:Trk K+ transport system NAD-binding subunit